MSSPSVQGRLDSSTIPGTVTSNSDEKPMASTERNPTCIDQDLEAAPTSDIKDETDGVKKGKKKKRVKKHAKKYKIQVKNARYYFQHPYSRLFISYFVVFCNFLIFAEDPVSHSAGRCEIPLVGNAIAFVFAGYHGGGFAILKVALWLIAIVLGCLVGKYLIHDKLLFKLMKLSMFSDDKGSWMVMFLTSIISVFIFSFIFNALLTLGSDEDQIYQVTSYIGARNTTFMKMAALGTWMGDFVTAWMVTDMMLQEKVLYPHWSKSARSFWQRGLNRIWLFWLVLMTMTVIVATAIITDYLEWDDINRDFVTTNEISRAFLASWILLCDLFIVMQDWEFPQFQQNLDIKLPGVDKAVIKLTLPDCLNKESWAVHITGKWFNYGIIFLVMILDLNMWKNQIFYEPHLFGQYTDSSGYIYTVWDKEFLETANSTTLSYDWRWSHINPATNQTYGLGDLKMNSKYLGFPLGLKGIAFVPSIVGFIVFGVLVWKYGREELIIEEIVKDGQDLQKPRNKVIILDSEDIEVSSNKSSPSGTPRMSSAKRSKQKGEFDTVDTPRQEQRLTPAPPQIPSITVTGSSPLTPHKVTTYL